QSQGDCSSSIVAVDLPRLWSSASRGRGVVSCTEPLYINVLPRLETVLTSPYWARPADVRVLPQPSQDCVWGSALPEPAGIQALQCGRGRRRQDAQGTPAVLGRLLAHLQQPPGGSVRSRDGAPALGRRQRLGGQRPAEGPRRLRVLRKARGPVL